MPVSFSLKITSFALIAALALAGCESSEERAEGHYQNALSLLAENDHDRALVELRNVFQLNGSHREARHAIADLLLTHFGQRQQAYSQYLRLVEQYPDDLEARIILSEIAFGAANWDEVERHGSKAAELAPEDPRIEVISIIRAYRAAAVDDNQPELRAQARTARSLVATLPDNKMLRALVIDADLREGNDADAIENIDWMLEQEPDNIRYWRQRLNLLARAQDFQGIEDQLREMVARFPEDVTNKQSLIRFYLTRQQPDKAEAFLRELVADEPQEAGPRVDLIRFLTEVRGDEVALVEIDKAIEDQDNPVPYQALRAALVFEQGKAEEAISGLEAILEGNEEPSEQINNIKITLARMLVATNNNVGARARVEEVLVDAPNHVEALKMQALWLIDSDDVDKAISGLRTALDQESEDAEAMTLMAQAYTRSGRPELARDFLALAVDASGNAPAESVRYASLLIEDESYLAAEDILLPALRIAPQNIEILTTLGQIYINMEDFGRMEQVVQTLRRLTDPRAAQAANDLEAARLNTQAGPEEAIQFLETLADDAEASLASKISVLRARVSTGNLDGAVDLARTLAEEEPENIAIKRILATTETLAGNLDVAEAIYNELLENNPDTPLLWLELSLLKARQGDSVRAQSLVTEALEKFPDDRNLLWAQASQLERSGDIDGAIEIYQTIYDSDSSSVVVANNLASLLGTYRDDAESLEQAWRVARRFRNTEIPAVQDTYGWIAHRRGDSEEALQYLESAARNLPNDPVVQYHLGKVYQALERPENALFQFERVLELAGPADTRQQIVDSRAQIQELKAILAQTTD